MRRGLLVLTVLLAPLVAQAQGLGPIPGEERFAGLTQTNNQIGALMGFRQLDGDYFVQLTLRTELNLGAVGLGLQVPLNLRVKDNPPKNSGDYFGYIRKDDWSRKSEWLQIIRYVRLGHKRDDFYLRVGELSADLGHGTIMNRYLNNLDPTTIRIGSAFDVNTSYGGIETVASDLGALYDTGNPRSHIVGTRLYFKPYSLVDADSWLNMFAVGVSYVTDLNAPLTYKMDGTGKVLTTSQGELAVDTKTHASVWGLDVEAELLHSAMLDVIPYSDLNFITEAGWGWHTGVLTTFKLPIGIALSIPIRLEYRRFSSDYVPGYFDTFYETRRFSYATDLLGNPIPKATDVRAMPAGQGYNGVYGDLAFDFAGLVQVGAVYEAGHGDDRNLQVFASIPAITMLQAKAFYARHGITGTDDIFKFDDRSMAVAQLRYEMTTYVYLVGRGTRTWQLVTDAGGGASYKGKTDWACGLEFAITL